MKKSVFRFIPLFALMFFFTACHDDIYSDITNGGNGVEHNRQPLDSMDLYNIQIDKSTILTNLIRNNNGRYYLDLTEQDAEIEANRQAVGAGYKGQGITDYAYFSPDGGRTATKVGGTRIACGNPKERKRANIWHHVH